MVRIVAWNINGVRSLPRSLATLIESLESDICCFQETKVSRSMLDTDIAFVDGFNSYFGFCRRKEGYSGVATYCKDSCTPTDAREGLTTAWTTNRSIDKSARIDRDPSSPAPSKILDASDQYDQLFSLDELKSLDGEGRVVITKHRLAIDRSSSDSSKLERYLNIINVYCPRLDPERLDRKEFKRNFYRLLQIRATQLATSGDHVLIVGDLNCSHKPIDHCDPEADPDFDQNDSRRWMNEFLMSRGDLENDGESIDGLERSASSSGSIDRSDQIAQHRSDQIDHNRSAARPKFVDLFRYLHPTIANAYTCWSSYKNARVINFGSRIDYAIANYELIRSGLLDDVEHLTDVYGSDHCPIRVTLKNCRLVKSETPPPVVCTKFMPEFSGQQQRMHQFLVKRKLVEEEETVTVVEDEYDGGREGKKARKSAVVKMESKSKSSKNVVKSSNSRTLTDFFWTKSELTVEAELSTNASDNRSISQSNSQPSSRATSDVEILPTSSTIDSSSSQASTQTSSSSSENDSRSESVAQWKSIFERSKNEPPVCTGHGEPSVLRTSKKPGANLNRRFYSCGRPIGKKGDPNATCNFFRWAK